jgi:O-antigen ligase
LFGIGFEGFKGADHGHTAHNSFVVCLAELGLLGYVFWVGLLAFTISGLNSMLRAFKSEKANAAANGEDGESGNVEDKALDQENTDLDKWARAMRISFAGYISSAFFLSRAYTPSLYLILGMAAVVIYLASEKEEPAAWQPLSKLVAFSAGLGVAAIAVVYAALRLRSVFL